MQQRANIKLTEFLTVEDSLQLVVAKRRSRFIGAAGSFNYLACCFFQWQFCNKSSKSK